MKKNQKSLNAALFGFGKFGKNWARVLQETSGVKFCAVVVLSEKSANEARRILPGSVLITQNANEVFNNSFIDAVVIATPPSTHFKLCQKALRAKKHVLCEKPLVLSSNEAMKLQKERKKSGVIFMVGYQYIYNDYIQNLKKHIDKGVLGTIQRVVAEHRLSPVRTDVSCFWDVAPHALSIMHHFFGSFKVMSAKGFHDFNTAKAVVVFDKGPSLTIIASFQGKQKIRKFEIIGSGRSAMFDDTKSKEKLVITHPKKIPFVHTKEPLYNELLGFMVAIGKNVQPITDIKFGIAITKLLENIERRLTKI